MALRILSGGAIAALAGATMLAASSAPSSRLHALLALARAARRGRGRSAGLVARWMADGIGGWGWHGGWHRWGWGPRYGFAPVYRSWYGPGVRRRRCGIGRWGGVSARWW